MEDINKRIEKEFNEVCAIDPKDSHWGPMQYFEAGFASAMSIAEEKLEARIANARTEALILIESAFNHGYSRGHFESSGMPIRHKPVTKEEFMDFIKKQLG